MEERRKRRSWAGPGHSRRRLGRDGESPSLSVFSPGMAALNSFSMAKSLGRRTREKLQDELQEGPPDNR